MYTSRYCVESPSLCITQHTPSSFPLSSLSSSIVGPLQTDTCINFTHLCKSLHSVSHHVQLDLLLLQPSDDVAQLVFTERSARVREEDESLADEAALASATKRKAAVRVLHDAGAKLTEFP